MLQQHPDKDFNTNTPFLKSNNKAHTQLIYTVIKKKHILLKREARQHEGKLTLSLVYVLTRVMIK